jgi:hypothetical protein
LLLLASAASLQNAQLIAEVILLNGLVQAQACCHAAALR